MARLYTYTQQAALTYDIDLVDFANAIAHANADKS